MSIREAYNKFRKRMSEIEKEQLSLFKKADEIVAKEKASKIREKINLNDKEKI